MGGFASILGGALAGAGAGIAEKGKLDLAQRHAQAMETLRSGQRKEEATHQGQINENLSAGHDKRQADSQMALQNDNQEFQGNVGLAAAQAQAARDEADRKFKREMAEAQRAFDASEADKNRKIAAIKLYGQPIDKAVNEETGDVTLIFQKQGGGLHTEVVKGAEKKLPKASGAANDRPLTRYGSGGAPSGTNTGVVTFDPKTGRFSDEEN